MIRKTKRDPDNENLDRWLLTYADLITLLLAFFVVLYSMSKIDSGKFSEVSTALHMVLRGSGPLVLPEETVGIDKDLGDAWSAIGDLRILQSLIRTKLDELGLSATISANVDRRGLIIRVSESAFYDLGSADLRPEAYGVLNVMSDFLIDIPNHIRIEGHTDNLPISTDKFPSNWELSVNRATICVRYFVEKHKFRPDRISALGYGQYRPIASNDTVEGRRQNRRVDIIVLNWNERKKEPGPLNEDISRNAEKNSIPPKNDQSPGNPDMTVTG
ncbi:MAG: flagellar motor protein MotB [candidate division Zixibacteria bacterium]